MKGATARTLLGSLATAALLVVVAHRDHAHAQPSPAGVARNFNTSEYFDPPHQSQLKFQLTGAEARPEGNGKLRITGMRLQTFLENGERQIAVAAPECIYESAARTANSAGRLQVQSGDGRFSIEGEGFLWQGNQSFLTISNQVRSQLQRETNAPGTDAKPPLVITARRFEFDYPKRQGVFRGQVHGDDPDLEFDCGVLTASASTNGQSFDLLTAETDVSLVGRKDNLQAKGDRAAYTRSDEHMVLAGNTSWKQDRKEGRADRVDIQRLEGSFEANGNVALKLPRESAGMGSFFLANTNAALAPATNSTALVDVFADRIHWRSNLTVISGSVRVVDATNRLTCDKLTVQSATPAIPEETAIAEGNVAVSQGETGNRLRSQRAVYAKSDGQIVFTERPEWELDRSQGRADRVTIQNSTGEIHAKGNVAAKITLGSQQGSLLKIFPGAADTNRAPQVIEVFARELNAKERQVLLTGDARAHESPITGRESRLRSDVLEVRFGTNAQHIETIQARDNVVYEQGIPGVAEGTNIYRKMITRTLTAQSDPTSGALSSILAEVGVQVEQPGSTAKGERATFNTGTELLELTGNPTLETPQVIITDARTLVWDKAHNGFAATAPYKIKLRLQMAKKISTKPKP